MKLFPETATVDAKRLVCAKGLRAVGDGYVSILLPAYLMALGNSPFAVGVLTTATLLGSAGLTLLTGMTITRFGHRRALLAASALMILTGLGFASVQAFWPLLLIAFVGTLNPSSGDVSVFLPMEQSLLTRSVADKDRTDLFARYSLAGALMGAFGTLLAAVPEFAAAGLGITFVDVVQAMFVVYAAIGIAAGLLYRGLSDVPRGMPRTADPPLGPSRAIVYRMMALFSVDLFGGGFLVQTILALWLLQAFDLPVATAATIFFWSGLFSAAVLPGGRADCPPLRPRQHDGLHAFAVKPLPDRHPLRRKPRRGHRIAPGSQPALADGCSDADVLRHGGRHPTRAPRRGEPDVGSPQPRVCGEPGDRGLPAHGIGFCLAASDRRPAEGRL